MKKLKRKKQEVCPFCGNYLSTSDRKTWSCQVCGYETHDLDSLIQYTDSIKRAAQEDDIRESVFRHQFTHNASRMQQTAKMYFLSIGERDSDPSDRLMSRFHGHQPVVKKSSQRLTHSPRSGLLIDLVIDKETFEKGLLFWVRSINWLGPEEVEVDGGYYEDGLSASGNKYRLRREHGRWVVKESEMIWIS